MSLQAGTGRLPYWASQSHREERSSQREEAEPDFGEQAHHHKYNEQTEQRSNETFHV